MRKLTVAKGIGLFAGYLFGYLALFLPILLLVVDGRALIAEARYLVGNVDFSPRAAVVTADESSNETAETAINPFPQSAASLIIPKLGIAAPIIFSQSAENKDILRDLHSGAAHYPGSALFGERGVGIVLGHSSAFPWYQGNYGSVFSLLHRLTVGDEFFVFYENKIYTYRVSKTDIVMPKNFQVENPDGGSHLVLLSCWPVGTNWRRIVVFSDLVSVK